MCPALQSGFAFVFVSGFPQAREKVGREPTTQQPPGQTLNALQAEQKVVACDISRVFLQSDWPADNDCYIKFKGMMVKVLYEIYPSYKSKVLYNKDG